MPLSLRLLFSKLAGLASFSRLLFEEMAFRLVSKTISEKLLLGRCLPCLHESASKVQVPFLELDEYIQMYFTNYHIFYAYDPKKICKTGDMVLIKKLEKNIIKSITHEVLEIVYPLGDVTDPVTGEKCVGEKTRSELEKEAELYGKLEKSFNYAKAPKRGWQEGKKDFSDKEVYIRYHKFNEDEEEFDDPYSIKRGW